MGLEKLSSFCTLFFDPKLKEKDYLSQIFEKITCTIKCDVLRNLVQFLRFKKREKHAWRSVTFGKSNTPSWMFFTFFKLYKWYQIPQRIANVCVTGYVYCWYTINQHLVCLLSLYHLFKCDMFG